MGEYEKKIVTYAVMDNRSDPQIIKVQSVYSTKDGNNSSEKKISNLKVTLFDMYGTYIFHDTLIPGSVNYSYFVSEGLNLNRGGRYSLKITGDNVPDAYSNIIIPVKQDITLYYDSEQIKLTYTKNSSVKGYLHHLYVEFYLKDGTNILGNYRVEIPSELEIINDGKDTIKNYPVLTKDNNHIYSYANIFSELIAYKPSNDKIKLVVKRSIATVLSLDVNLYNYVSTVKGFSDPVSVRLDQINFSNISNGFGIFGAIAIDSTIEKIPAYIIQSFGFESE
jgi:hypothetical protein